LSSPGLPVSERSVLVEPRKHPSEEARPRNLAPAILVASAGVRACRFAEPSDQPEHRVPDQQGNQGALHRRIVRPSHAHADGHPPKGKMSGLHIPHPRLSRQDDLPAERTWARALGHASYRLDLGRVRPPIRPSGAEELAGDPHFHGDSAVGEKTYRVLCRSLVPPTVRGGWIPTRTC
jgi:hypothetical protein